MQNDKLCQFLARKSIQSFDHFALCMHMPIHVIIQHQLILTYLNLTLTGSILAERKYIFWATTSQVPVFCHSSTVWNEVSNNPLHHLMRYLTTRWVKGIRIFYLFFRSSVGVRLTELHLKLLLRNLISFQDFFNLLTYTHTLLVSFVCLMSSSVFITQRIFWYSFEYILQHIFHSKSVVQ